MLWQLPYPSAAERSLCGVDGLRLRGTVAAISLTRCFRVKSRCCGLRCVVAAVSVVKSHLLLFFGGRVILRHLTVCQRCRLLAGHGAAR